jgi:SAM-dependent methyltransferase
MADRKNADIVANYEEQARVSPFDMLLTGRYVSSLFGYAGRLGRFLADEMELKPADRVLDAGCSVGIYHGPLAARAASLVGVDASPTSVERARRRNKSLRNASYQVGDLLALKPGQFAHRFDKILCYSVVHILGGLDEFETLLRGFIGLLEGGHGVVFLGEMREKELYDAFKSRPGGGLRDAKFALLKAASRWLFRNARLKQGIPPTLFTRAEIEGLVRKLGGTCERLEEAPWHPFYNTCADYRLRF